jgi:hypothetical protein
VDGCLIGADSSGHAIVVFKKEKEKGEEQGCACSGRYLASGVLYSNTFIQTPKFPKRRLRWMESITDNSKK